MERAVQLNAKKLAAQKRGESLTYEELEEQALALSPTRIDGSPEAIAHSLQWSTKYQMDHRQDKYDEAHKNPPQYIPYP